jgi:hypothetical protein
MQNGITLGQYEAKLNLPRLTALFHARFGSATKTDLRVRLTTDYKGILSHTATKLKLPRLTPRHDNKHGTAYSGVFGRVRLVLHERSKRGV